MVLKETWAMYIHAHAAHWNIIGENFHSHHAFLGEIYSGLWEAVDGIAEHIRALDIPVSATVLTGVSSDPGMNWEGIRQRLLADNEIVVDALKEACEAADEVEDEALCNFLADRLDKHAKLGWMLRASR
jgi:starvation-inducible DNA-binding protein